MDYRFLNQAIALKPRGVAGKDSQLKNIEQIFGAANQRNQIDALSAGTGASLTLVENPPTNGIQSQQLIVNVVGQGQQQFNLQNFVDVTGTALNDFIQFDSLLGVFRDNTLRGLAGDDILSGG